MIDFLRLFENKCETLNLNEKNNLDLYARLDLDSKKWPGPSKD